MTPGVTIIDTFSEALALVGASVCWRCGLDVRDPDSKLLEAADGLRRCRNREACARRVTLAARRVS
jgi:hypothetical protein